MYKVFCGYPGGLTEVRRPRLYKAKRVCRGKRWKTIGISMGWDVIAKMTTEAYVDGLTSATNQDRLQPPRREVARAF